MLEGLQECGIAQEPLQPHLQDARIMQRPCADEVLHKLRDCVVGEEGQVEGLRIVKELLQFLIIPCPNTGSHCTVMGMSDSVPRNIARGHITLITMSCSSNI